MLTRLRTHFMGGRVAAALLAVTLALVAAPVVAAAQEPAGQEHAAPAHAGGHAPGGEINIQLPDLNQGDFLGMTMRHNRGHFVRALYEGIAFSLCDVLGEFRAQGIEVSQVRIIGGGSRSATWRQIVADVLGVRVELPERTDASCRRCCQWSADP